MCLLYQLTAWLCSVADLRKRPGPHRPQIKRAFRVGAGCGYKKQFTLDTGTRHSPWPLEPNSLFVCCTGLLMLLHFLQFPEFPQPHWQWHWHFDLRRFCSIINHWPFWCCACIYCIIIVFFLKIFLWHLQTEHVGILGCLLLLMLQ